MAFVGRVDELEWLERCLATARGGQPVVAVVSGEAGIGKTRLLRQFERLATRSGARVAWGRGYQDFSVPLLTITEAVQPAISECFDKIAPRLGADARLLEDVLLEAGNGRRAADGEDSENRQRRLALLLVRAIFELARERPLALVVDDLHWVDQASLQMLSHLIFAAADAASREKVPLLVVASTRPIDRDEMHGRIVERIERETICQTLDLVGLSEAEAGELIAHVGFPAVSRSLVTALNEQTRGNPLFLQEIARHLLRRHADDALAPGMVADRDLLDRPLPADFTTTITARLANVDKQARELLVLSSFLREPFTVATLGAAAGVDTVRVREITDDAIRLHLLAGDGRSLRFFHPLVRQVLYGDVQDAKREQTHASIAHALERLYAARADEHAIEICHHLISAGSIADPSAVLAASVRAGDKSFRNGSWMDAARFYRSALASGERGAPLAPGERADLHYRAGVAHFRNQDAAACFEQFNLAVESFEALGDRRGLARALAARVRAQITLVSVGYGTLIDSGPLERAAEAVVDIDPALAGLCWADVAQLYWTGRRPDAARQTAERALELGLKLQDAMLCAEAYRALSLAQCQTMDVVDATDSLLSALAWARQTHDAWVTSHVAQRIPLALVWRGRFDEAVQRAREAAEQTQLMHDWGDHSLARGALVCIHAARGSFENAERHAKHAMVMLRRSGYPWAGPTALPALAKARMLRGDYVAADDALAIMTTPGEVFEDPGVPVQVAAFVLRALVAARAATTESERSSLREKVAPLAVGVTPEDVNDVYALGVLSAFVELADLLEIPDLLNPAMPALTSAARKGVAFSSGWICLVSRILGIAAGLRGEREEAEDRFGEAVAQATASDARAELALTYLDHARMLRKLAPESAHAQIGELLRECRRIAVDLRMQPTIRDVDQLCIAVGIPTSGIVSPAGSESVSPHDDDLWIRETMGKSDEAVAAELLLTAGTIARKRRALREVGVAPPVGVAAMRSASLVRDAMEIADTAATPRIRVILLTDIVGSTRILEQLGDVRGRKLFAAHDALLRQEFAHSGGTVVKHTGDGFLVSFVTASDAVACAVGVQRKLAESAPREGEHTVHVRIGLTAGEPIAESGDLFGAAVNAAARICGRAGPGEILVSDVVRLLMAGGNAEFVDRGRVSLDGFSRRSRLFAVSWEKRD